MDGPVAGNDYASVIPFPKRSHRDVEVLDCWGAVGKVAAGCQTTAIAIGSDEHKTLFCRMLLDTFRPYKPDSISWPELDDGSCSRLRSLPIWDIAVQTEGKACLRVLSYGDTVDDPLLQRALRLNAFEEARHKRLLNSFVSCYGIDLCEEPPYQEPRDPEWAFMITGFSECIDSFFAFGLFEACRRRAVFPAPLAEAFEPVMQEEGRHILFFANWVAWHRRRLPWWRQPIFIGRIAGVLLFLVWERIHTARDFGGNNFTMTGSAAIDIDLGFANLLELCLAENERRLAIYDPRLRRPMMMPRVARLVRLIMRCYARLSGEM